MSDHSYQHPEDGYSTRIDLDPGSDPVITTADAGYSPGMDFADEAFTATCSLGQH